MSLPSEHFECIRRFNCLTSNFRFESLSFCKLKLHWFLMLANEHSNTMNKIETQCMAIRSMFDSCAHSSYYTMQWRQEKDLSLNQRTNERTNEIYFTHDMIWRFCSFLLHFHSFLRCVCNGTDFGVHLPFYS